MKTLATLTSLVVLSLAGVSAQRPADAPPTGPAGKAPDTVFLEDLTWAEARDLVKAGTTTVIIGTAGTEQKGPHMVDGEHKFVLEYAADKIARGLGKTLVAPIITYVPEGSWDPPSGHMGKPGTITLPEDRFVELLVNAGRSLKSGGFTTILFVGESGGNRTGMRTAAARLNELWKGERQGVLGRRLLHQVARRPAHLHHEQARDPRRPDWRARQHPGHVGDAVRQCQACAEEQAGAWWWLRKQRRQRRPDQGHCRTRQDVRADQDRQRHRTGEGIDCRHHPAGNS